MDFGSPKKVLVAPLNWGLGHTSRVIPIIKQLLAQGHEVFLASDGEALELLRLEFPNLRTFVLTGYQVHYGGKNLLLSLTLQLPKIVKSILKEYFETAAIVKKENIDIVISDNRLGCRSPKSYNIIITHQINLVLNNRLLADLASKTNHILLNKFDEVWVPDLPPPDHITGLMSNNNLKTKVVYVGPLSRLKKLKADFKRECLVILSGPEPLRTEFEEKIINQAIKMPDQFLIVRGLPLNHEGNIQVSDNVILCPFMTSDQLSEAISHSQFVIARTGYTTIMDMISLNQPCILVPTPGQPEQEYLGEQLKTRNNFIIADQKSMDLNLLIQQLKIRSNIPE